jgi:hypothetical protein
MPSMMTLAPARPARLRPLLSLSLSLSLSPSHLRAPSQTLAAHGRTADHHRIFEAIVSTHPRHARQRLILKIFGTENLTAILAFLCQAYIPTALTGPRNKKQREMVEVVSTDAARMSGNDAMSVRSGCSCMACAMQQGWMDRRIE